MSDTVIKVENLSKKYILSHLADKREQLFSRLLVNKAKTAGSKVLNIFRSAGGGGGGERTTEEFWALKDVYFEIKQGDRVGIIGRNGAGKSTLLKVLSRITEPTKGRITIDGRVASLLEVGTGFHSELTGRENIYLNGAILGMSREEIKRKFDEIVAFAEVERFLDTPVKRYSSGMYVRLAFAVAAHLEPEILIVDEVLAVGDAAFQKKCLGKMEDVSTKEGRTVLFVSHNMSSLKAICNTGIFLANGQIETIGDIDVVTTTYYKQLENISNELFVIIKTEHIDITEIKLCDNKRNKIDVVDTDTDIYLTIIYKIKNNNSYGFTITLYRDESVVFQSINNNDITFFDVKQSGMYESICHIPGKLLNNGHYHLMLTIFENNYMNPVDIKNALSFTVNDGLGVRRDYSGGILGTIRPSLEWRTMKYDNQARFLE